MTDDECKAATAEVVSILVSYRLRDGDAPRIYEMELPSPSIRPPPRLVIPVGDRRAIVYRKGVIQVGGLRSFAEVDQCRSGIQATLSDAGVEIMVTGTAVLNVVSQFDLGRKVNLDAFVESLCDCEWTYEPEIFPGVILKKWGVTFLVFASGRVIMTGLKDITRCDELWSKFDRFAP